MFDVRPSVWAGVLWAWLASSGYPSTAAVLADQSSDRDYTRAAADAYLTNREAFTDFLCDYQLTAGFADDMVAAREGRLHDAMTGEGRWRVAGTKVRDELVCDRAFWDRAVTRARSKEGEKLGLALPLTSQVLLCDGQIQLVYTSFGRFGNLCPPEARSAGFDNTPWDMLILGPGESKSPARRIQEALGRGLYCDVQQVSIGQHNLARISLGESASKLSCRMDLDPERGFLPVEFTQFTIDGKAVAAQVFMTDMRQASNGHWFPYHAQMISPRPAGQPMPVRICKVTKLELGAPPEKEFETQVDRGAKLLNIADPAAEFWIGETERVTPKDLGALLERSNRAAAARHEEKAAAAPGRAPSSNAVPAVTPQSSVATSVWPTRAAAVGLALVLAIATYFVVKTIQSRRTV